jgi:hypothetical protein
MRLINFSKVVALTAVVAVFCIYSPAGAADPEGWTITQVTDNTYDDTNPQISGPNVAWEGGGMIYFYDGTDVTWIEESFDGQKPQISLNNVVWEFYDDLSPDLPDYEIFFYNGTLTQLLTNNDYHDENPQISGNKVVWQSNELGSGNTQIMLYDPDATPKLKTLTNLDRDNEVPQISGENVVWQGYYDPWPEPGVIGYKIFYYDGSNIHQLTDNFSDYSPQISGNNVTWQGYATNSTEIFYCEAPYGSIKQLTDNTVEDSLPQISGSTVVWQSRVPDTPWPYLHEVYMCDASEAVPSPVKLVGSLDNVYPQVSGSNVAWQGFDGSDNEIFFYDGAADEIIQLTDNDVDDSLPQISGDNVAWQGLVYDYEYETYFYQIFLAEKLSAADIEVSPLTYDFGQILVGQSATTIITITNVGNNDLTINSIDLAQKGPASYSIESTLPGMPFVLASDEFIAVEIKFSPSKEKLVSAVLEIVSDDPDENIVQVSLSGTGYVLYIPDINVSPLTYDFEDVRTGRSATTTVTISNLGNTLLYLETIEFTPESSDAFSIVPEIDPNDLPIVLRTHGPKTSIDIEIEFNPLDIGEKSAVLEIGSDDPDSYENPVIVNFTGTGIQLP